MKRSKHKTLLCFLFCLISPTAFYGQISLSYPNDNLILPDSVITFTWDSQNNISQDTFSLCVSDNQEFTQNVSCHTTTQKYLSLTLNNNRTYFWKVINTNFETSETFKVTLFNPDYIDSLKIWVNTDTISSPIGTNISNWNDISGNNNSLSQLNPLNTPTINLGDSLISFFKTVHFDGINDFYQKQVPSLNQPVNYFMLIRSNNFNGFLFDGYTPYSVFIKWFNSAYAIFCGSSYIISNSTYTVPTYKIINLEANNQFTKFFVNGNLEGTGSAGNMSPNGVTLGASASLSEFNDIDIAELLVINDTLKNTDRDLVTNYLMNKFSPPVNLMSDITHVGTFCNTVIDAGNRFKKFLWSTGDTTSKISVNKSGKYWVRATNVFDQISSDTIVITYPKITPILEQTILCPNNEIIWNTNLKKNLFSFNWSDNSSDSILVINQAGNYYVTVFDTLGCFFSSDTVTVSIDNFPSLASLGPDTSLCAGNSITLTTGNQTGLIYSWNDNSTDSTLTINSTGQYWLEVTNSNNCIAKDTINVTIIGQAPLAGFQNTITCENSSINFTDTSLALGGANITNWFWNFGDASATNDTSILAQPTYTYADTGSFTISLTVTTDAGCKQNLSKNIRVYPKPIVDFTNVIACQNDTAFFNDAINPLGYPITNYQWNFGDASSGTSNTDTNSDPFHVFSQNTTYQVQLIAKNNQGCIDSITKPIAVRDEVSADFNYTSACINIPINFTDNSIAPSPNTSNTRMWNFFPGTATGLSATKTFTSAGIYPVRLTVTGFNNCVSSVTKQVEVFLPPDADFTNATSCVLDSFQLTDVSLPINGAINSWQWKFAGNTFSTNQNPKYVLNISGNSNIFLKVSNDKGCVDSVTKVVYANPLPDASFNLNPNTYLFNDSPISFTPNFSSAVNYFWNVSDGNTYSDPSLNLTFTNQGVYNVSLQLTDNLGCKNNSSQSFSVGVRNTDLGIIAARSTIDNDGFVGVEADLYNFGSTPITEFEILYELTGGGIMKESWNADTLPPNAVLLFKFSSKTFLTITERENAISCITIQTVNTKLDDNISNNENCAALNSNKQLVAEPYPNPADGDVTLPIVLTEDQTITITVYDYIGKLIAENLSYDGITGLNFIKIPSAAYSSGTYTLKISISDNNYTRKLIKQGSGK